MAVVTYHAFPDQLPGGFAGVDVFFVISGFLITGIILRAIERGAFSFADFYARRVRRIFPALLLVLAACWAVGWFFLIADEYASLGKHVAGGTSFVSNFVLWDEVGYFDLAAGSKPLLHLWSLAVEEQFYLVWPLLLWLGARGRRSALPLTAMVLVLSFAVGLMYLRTDESAAFYSPMARLWELLIGAVLVQLAGRIQIRGAVASVLSIVGIGAILASFVVLDRQADFPGWRALLPTIGTALVIGAGPGAVINRCLAIRVLTSIGLVSYPIYLWHWPILAFLKIVEGPLLLGARLGAIAVSVVLAVLTYWLFEQPMRSGARRRKVLALCGAMMVIGGVGLYTYVSDGLRSRSIQEGVPDFTAYGFEASRACRAKHPYADPWCYDSASSYPTTLMVIGDSHAYAMAPGLVELSARGQLGMNLVVVARPRCLPFDNIELFDDKWKTRACRRFSEPALDEAIGDPRITTVVLMSRFAADVLNRPFGDEHDWAPGYARYDDGTARADSPGEVFRLGLEHTLQRLAARRIEVIFIDQVPELGFEPHDCVRRPQLFEAGDRTRCDLPLADVVARQQAYREIAASVLPRFPNVVRVDPVPLFCAHGSCSAWRAGQMLYHDDCHLSPAGGGVLAAAIRDALPR